MVGVVRDCKVGDECVYSRTGGWVVDVEDSVCAVGAKIARKRVGGTCGGVNCGVGVEEADAFVSFDGISVKFEMVCKKLVGCVRV